MKRWAYISVEEEELLCSPVSCFNVNVNNMYGVNLKKKKKKKKKDYDHE